ncbi:MAG: branched-chain amino acid ABC transporter permease/ATP-binding protein, partial [Solirubrobacteraceae bacterium]
CALGTVTGSNYDPNMSLTLMVVVAIVAGGEPWYALVAALLAIPAVRLSGLYLALATFGFGLLVQAMFYQSSVGFGVADLGLAMPRPTWLGLSGDRGFYFLLLALTVLASGAVIWLIQGRLGGLLRMLGSSPLTLEAFGVNITVTRILVFCLSAFIAAIAGALAGCALGTARSAP